MVHTIDEIIELRKQEIRENFPNEKYVLKTIQVQIDGLDSAVEWLENNSGPENHFANPPSDVKDILNWYPGWSTEDLKTLSWKLDELL